MDCKAGDFSISGERDWESIWSHVLDFKRNNCNVEINNEIACNDNICNENIYDNKILTKSKIYGCYAMFCWHCKGHIAPYKFCTHNTTEIDVEYEQGVYEICLVCKKVLDFTGDFIGFLHSTNSCIHEWRHISFRKIDKPVDCNLENNDKLNAAMEDDMFRSFCHQCETFID